MRWIEPLFLPPKEIFPGVHPLVAQTLQRRGFSTPDAIRAFLNPDEYQPCPATELPGMPDAVEILKGAITRNESICIWGDFDVDGQTSTTILYEALGTLGADVIYHIPVRETESHGINVPVLKTIRTKLFRF